MVTWLDRNETPLPSFLEAFYLSWGQTVMPWLLLCSLIPQFTGRSSRPNTLGCSTWVLGSFFFGQTRGFRKLRQKKKWLVFVVCLVNEAECGRGPLACSPCRTQECGAQLRQLRQSPSDGRRSVFEFYPFPIPFLVVLFFSCFVFRFADDVVICTAPCCVVLGLCIRTLPLCM